MMSPPDEPPALLWALSPEEFNEWRATNDLPRLYSFFLQTLPGFGDWLDAFQIDADQFCRVVPTGDFFIGKARRVTYRNDSFFPHKQLFGTIELSAEEYSQSYRHRGEPVPRFLEFQPYFVWAKETLKA